MASKKVKPVDIKAEVLDHLKLALKTACTNLGEDYNIEKSQKELFFENISIKEFEHKFQCFRPYDGVDQANETDTEFHVEKPPAIRTGSTGQELQLKGSTESSFPTLLNFWKLSADISGLVHRKSSDDWIECTFPVRQSYADRKDTEHNMSVKLRYLFVFQAAKLVSLQRKGGLKRW